MKPQAVLRAQYALAAWTAWTCLFGIYQVWNPSGLTQDVMAQFESLGTTPGGLRGIALGFYALLGASMIGIVMQIGAGKSWPRTLVLISFVIEVLWIAGQGESSALAYLADVPDVGLQGYALYLLYTTPGRDWFRRTS